MLADTATESSVFWTLLLRFCGGVAKREWEYSIVFTVSNAHHTFLDKMCFVIIFACFRASVGEPFGSFCVLLGGLFEVLFLTTFQGNRVTAGEAREIGCGGVGSLKQLPQCPASGQGPTQNRLPGPRDPRDL